MSIAKNLGTMLLLTGLVAPVFAQVAARGDARASASVPAGAPRIPTQLLSGLSSKTARAGQPVMTKLTQQATLADGSTLPSGSTLMGHLTQVQPLTKDAGTSSLQMLFDQVKTPDGKLKSIASSVQGVGKGTVDGTAPRPTSNMRSGGTVVGGGLLGGVTNTVGGVVTTTTGLVGSLTGLPGVLLGADGTLSAKGRNVEVPAGTTITLQISAQ